MKIYKNVFNKIISPENLFAAWDEFKKGKQKKPDVQQFERYLEQNIFQLHRELKRKTYRHGPYTSFYINDPKPRHIHKALARDRIVHHAVFKTLYPLFDPTFINDSYSCRENKGTHKGVRQLASFLRKASKNNTLPCYVLKCDIKKFFHSVDHTDLITLVSKHICGHNAVRLIREIVESFPTGIPIGNLTSQLLANIYLNELDQYVKHLLKIPYYIRYTDDFVIVDNSPEKLKKWLCAIHDFLGYALQLELHPQKVILLKYHQGIDFLGYITFPHHALLRTKTKRRIMKKVSSGISEQSFQSYLGVLSHASTYKLTQDLKNTFWLNKKPHNESGT